MLQLFRNFFKSKFGVIVTLLFLVVIAIAFGVGNVASTGSIGGSSSSDKVAVVGSAKIDASDLSVVASSALDSLRQRNPSATMPDFVANGGLDRTLKEMIDRTALSQLGYKYGLRAGTRLVDSEIVKTSAFQGADGKFSEAIFRSALRQQGITEKEVRTDIANGLYARQLITPVALDPQVPDYVAMRYTQLQHEKRKGKVMVVPAGAFAPKAGPTDKQLQAFYDAHKSNYLRPERRIIRYASFGAGAITDVPKPTAAEIQARYNKDKAQYEASQLRSFTQLVVQSEKAAKSIAAKVKQGESLDKAASDEGLTTTTIKQVNQSDLATNTSAAVAKAGFAAARGKVSDPAQGPLGWYLLRVDTVTDRPARSLDQVRSQIVAQLTKEERRKALNKATSHIDDEFSNGTSLSQVAKEMNLTLTSTQPVTANGQIYGTQKSAPPVLARALSTAFQMQQYQPQIAEVVPGKTFLIFDVSKIIPSSVAPLKDIKDMVTAQWKVDTAMKGAGDAAKRILDRVNKGQSLADAVKAEKEKLPPPREVDLSRDQVAKDNRLPKVLALYFIMAKDSTKLLEGRREGAWYVVQVNAIDEPKLAANDPEIKSVQGQLESAKSDEYIQEFVQAARNQIVIHKNKAAIEAVAKQLTGQGN